MPKVIDFTMQKLEPLYDAENARMIDVKLPNSVTYAKGTVLGELVGANARHKLTPSLGANLPTGGTFNVVITASGHAVLGTVTLTSGNLTPQSTAEEIQNSLDNGTVSAGAWVKGQIKVTGGPIGSGAPVFIEFVGGYGAGVIAATVTTITNNLTGGTPTVTVSLAQAGAAGTPGTFKAYSQYNTDGSQLARIVLAYDVVVDASGNHYIGGQAASEWGQYDKAVPAYYCGTFKTDDLVGLDQNAVSQLGRLASGTVASGTLRVG